MFHNLYIDSPVERWLGCFQFLVTVNDVAINICVQILHECNFLIRLGEYPEAGLLGWMRKYRTSSKLGMEMWSRRNVRNRDVRRLPVWSRSERGEDKKHTRSDFQLLFWVGHNWIENVPVTFEIEWAEKAWDLPSSYPRGEYILKGQRESQNVHLKSLYVVSFNMPLVFFKITPNQIMFTFWWFIYYLVIGYDEFESISHYFTIMKIVGMISGEAMIKKYNTNSEKEIRLNFILKSVKRVLTCQFLQVRNLKESHDVYLFLPTIIWHISLCKIIWNKYLLNDK